jgi:hypothetical protein
MHVSGKIFAFLTVLCGIGALVMSSKAIQVRTRWMEVVQKREAEVKKNDEDIAAREAKLNLTTGELRRTLLPWDRYWSPVPAAVANPATGELQANIGTSAGVKENMQLHAFAKLADGSFLYAGPFQVKRVNEATCNLEPDWRYRDSEGANWPRGEWRFRTVVPAQYPLRFTQFESEFIRADQLFAERTNELARQQTLLQMAQEHLALRIGEINGFDDLKGRTLPPEMIDGYLTTLVSDEEARNTLLVEVDSLRRQLLDTNNQISSLLEENSQLQQALEAAAPVTDGLTRN